MRYPESANWTETQIISSVVDHGDYWSISTGYCGWALAKSYYVTPKPGDRVSLALHNGSTVRGVILNKNLVYYKTDEDLAEEHRVWVEDLHRRQAEEFERNRSKLDAEYEALPECFRHRIDRFRLNNPEFRVQYEQYELFCCREAVKIANALRTPEAVQAWAETSFKNHLATVPDLDHGHSGNTLGMATRLAYLYLMDTTQVSQQHGALSVLVGSKAYGDVDKEGSVGL